MKLALLLLLACVGCSWACGAKELLSLIADVVKKSPPDNRFISMINNNTLKMEMVDIFGLFAELWTEQYVSTTGQCILHTAATIGKRLLIASPVVEKQAAITKEEILSILNSKECRQIILKGVRDDLQVPHPTYASGGVTIGSLQVVGTTSIRGKLQQQQQQQQTAADALQQKVQRVVTNPVALKLFRMALDDYTVRVALYNVCTCNPMANFIEFYANTMLG